MSAPVTSSMPASDNDLESVLDQLDVADTAVRALYRKLADDPDLADECETTLRELHGKRNELARLVGLAALLERRRAQKEDEASAQLPVEPATVTTSELDDEAAKLVEEPGIGVVSFTASAVDAELPPDPPSPAPSSEVPAVPVRQRAFQFGSLEWIPRNRPRMVTSLAERAAQRTIDFVLVTKFVGRASSATS